MKTEWHKITDRAPPEKQLLMVAGPSGYCTHKTFLALAYIDEDYRPSRGGPLRWLDVTNESLSDLGWYPTHWAHQINLPEIA
ncbi:hypothetical protein [Mesorhizobium sp. M00.F.Ca.ET.217.01.1.1]|uniref:hypothetical protein n=1 Tax=Mesorhizobium sp. M00.F.Ca.ET.217.01.1.1 TaxID=2500529 RepID=UPI000FDB4961|nr:hypothetical protein [Mesorhizobium sp. M00.F.Ca.ET.217.01.1.1]TGQ19270.1 hypothetical protein EN860_019245 [Mesorhizobium sp. M00.F.Ca.ET.217.01.1.1]